MEKMIKIYNAIFLNDVMNNAKFKDLKDEAISSLLEFKFQLSKIVKDKDDFVKESIENLKSDRFKELQDKERTEEEQKEFDAIIKELDKTVNNVVNSYMLKDINIEVNNMDKSQLFLFCKINDINIATTEMLYNLLVQ